MIMSREQRQQEPVARCHGERRAGFTLAEVLVALCIVAALLAGVFGLARQSLRIADEMKSELRAAQVAESEMERLRAMDWGQLVKLGSSYALDAAGTGLAALDSASGVVRVSPVPDEGNGNDIRAVSVHIAWLGLDGRKKEVALATLMTSRRPGL
jgi:prepilin-type N-terminal cleavage/methylation domain-containing protein